MPQLSQSGRLNYLVAISQGNWYYALAGAAAWTAANNTTGNTPPSIFTGLVMTAANGQKLYAADGSNWVRFDPLTGNVEAWTASAGTLPVDSANNTPRLICTWRGRTVVSGLLLSPQQIFMSRVGDPRDWLYLPVDPAQTDPFATTVGQQGAVGDQVTALIPFTDDVLVIGTSHEIHVLQGDPLVNGQLGRLTNAIGIAWGRAYCQDPSGTIYFMSNRGGVFAMVPGSVPQEISAAIRPLLVGIDTGANGIRLVWDDRFQGLHVFVTKLSAPGATTHFFWDARTAGWFTEEFANHNHDPLCVLDFDGNTAADRAVLLGGFDGYVRAFSQTADHDDGTPIASNVLLGPVATKNLDEVNFGDAVCVLGETSNPVSYTIRKGDTAEQALTAAPVNTGTWTAGRNNNIPISRAAHALFCGIGSDGKLGGWAFEQLRITVGTRGLVRGRGKG